MRPIKIVLVGVIALVIACGSGDEPNAEPDSDSAAITTPEKSPAEPTRSAPAPTPTASTVTRPDLPAFDLANFENGDEIAELIAEVGEERAYPAELLIGSPELPIEEARALLEDYLSDSRIVFIRRQIRHSEIDTVDDFCDNGMAVRTWHSSTQYRQESSIGFVYPWSIAHTDITPWNQPYVTTDDFVRNHLYQLWGFDALGYSSLRPPQEDGLVRYGAGRDVHIRVFDNPGCADPALATDLDPLAWDLLKIGQLVSWPEELRISAPQLPPTELVAIWKEAHTDILTYNNLNGFPYAYNCGGRAVMVSRNRPDMIGEVYSWSIEEAADVINNGVWYIYDWDDPAFDEEKELMFVPAEQEFHQGVFAAQLTNCSIEEGLALADQIRAELEER